MKSSLGTLQCLLLGLISVVFAANKPPEFDFDTVIEKYRQCLENSFGKKVDWIDAYALNPFFTNYPEYSEHRIFAFVNKTIIGEEEVTENIVLRSYPEQMDVNIAPTPVKIDFNEELKLRTKETVFQEKTIKFKVEMTISISIWFFSASATAGIEKTDKSSTETTEERTHTTVSARSYTVNPYTRARVQTALVRRKGRQPYTMEVAIEGDLAVKFQEDVPDNARFWEKCGVPPFKSKLGVHFIHIGSLIKMANEHFPNEGFKRQSPTSLVYPINVANTFEEDKLVFKIRGKVIENEREKAFNRFCK